MPPTRRLRPAVLAAALLASSAVVPLSPGVAGADDGGPPPDSILQPMDDKGATAVRPFLDVPGVDLAALGYAGLPLDADVIERATAPLPDEPRQRVAEIATRLDLVPPQLDALVQAQAALDAALAALDAEVAAHRDSVAVADLVAEDAERRVEDARRRVRLRADELAAHRRRMAEVAVAAYMRPPGADALGKVLEGASASTEDLAAGVLFTVKADHDGVVRDDLELARAVADERLDREVVLRDGARARAEAAQAALAASEARRQSHRDAAALVAAARSSLDAALPVLRADMDRTIEETWGSLELIAGGQGVGDDAIVAVEGIRVHAAIAPRLQALLAAAHADGVPLGGWGYRSVHQQIELRRAHCGDTPEDIFLKPSSECSPPTARPGTSMHERGLAVDFHLAGRSIASHDSPGYQWLAAHAEAFGFRNLPSEPWHWSVNAQ